MIGLGLIINIGIRKNRKIFFAQPGNWYFSFIKWTLCQLKDKLKTKEPQSHNKKVSSTYHSDFVTKNHSIAFENPAKLSLWPLPYAWPLVSFAWHCMADSIRSFAILCNPSGTVTLLIIIYSYGNVLEGNTCPILQSSEAP